MSWLISNVVYRFRAQAELASVAAKLPLDDSDDGDSMISSSTTNGTLSRNNSTGDVRKVISEVLLTRQNSNEVGLHSELNSE